LCSRNNWDNDILQGFFCKCFVSARDVIAGFAGQVVKQVGQRHERQEVVKSQNEF
jgi:hypothetical protein